MAYKYTVREKAVEDIEEIIAYIADDNPKAALKLYQTFLKHFDQISIFPEMGSLRTEFTPAVRSLAVGSYIIYYTHSDPVSIIRVLHGARNIDSNYFKE